MPAMAIPGKKNARSFWLVPTLEFGNYQKKRTLE